MEFDYEKYPDGIADPLKFLDHEERVWDRGYYCEVENGCWYELYVNESVISKCIGVPKKTGEFRIILYP